MRWNTDIGIDNMTLIEIVMKLVGPVQPYGDSYADMQRLSNLKKLTELTDYLLGEISKAAESANRQEASMKAIGKHAEQFLNDIRNSD